MALKTLGKNGLSIPLTIAAGVILTAASFSIEFRAIKDAIEDKLNAQDKRRGLHAVHRQTGRKVATQRH